MTYGKDWKNRCISTNFLTQNIVFSLTLSFSQEVRQLKISFNFFSFQVSRYDKVWYDGTPVGKNMLNDFMKNLCIKLNLTQLYTNHCVRATALTLLDTDGFEAHHIMAVSGHKNESMIKSSYSVKCPPQKKCQISDSLSKQLGKPVEPEVKKLKAATDPEPTHTATHALPSNDASLLQNFEDFVPIHNNAADFILDIPLDEFNTPMPEENALVPMENIPPVQNIPAPQETPAIVPVTTSIQNKQQNINFGYPMIPKNDFSGCNVTINYNFFGPKWTQDFCKALHKMPVWKKQTQLLFMFCDISQTKWIILKHFCDKNG